MRFALFVHSSQQREERTKKRRRCYRAFGFVAMVTVGVCGTRFARTVLALFPPSFLRLHRPIKAGILLVLLLVFLTPSVLRTPPLYFALQNTGEEGESNPPLIAVRYPAYGVRQGKKWNHTEF